MAELKDFAVKDSLIFLVIILMLSGAYTVSLFKAPAATKACYFAGEEVVISEKTLAPVVTKASPVVADEISAAQSVIARPAAMTSPSQTTAILPISPPTVMHKVTPAYPSSVLEKGLQGTVLLAVYIGLNGLPEKIESKISSGINELDRAATDAVSQWRFSPAAQGSQAMASWYEVPVRFTIQ